MSGTPTTIGTYAVTLTVTDASTTRTDTTDFNWTIAYPPVVAVTPNRPPTTANTAIASLQMTATGGSATANQSWTGGASLPPGLSMTSAGLITGTPITPPAPTR